MIMRQDRSTDDRQVGVRTSKVMWELFDEGEQTCKRIPIDDHVTMFLRQNDAMFVVVDIR